MGGLDRPGVKLVDIFANKLRGPMSRIAGVNNVLAHNS